MEEKKNKKKIIAIGAIILGVIIAILLFLTCCVGTKEYTVKFDTNGGSKIQDVVVKENDTVKKPTDPTKKGYIFGGWYYKGKLFNFSTKITKDITLKARFIYENIEEQLTKLEKEEMLELYRNIEIPLAPVLAKMEITGIKVDRQLLDEMKQEIQKQIEDVQEQIYTYAK